MNHDPSLVKDPAADDHEIDIDGDLDRVPVPADRLVDWVRMALEEASAPCSVGVQIVDRDTIRAMNGQFRSRDKATNVLSFPAEVPAPLPVRPLGDVVVCADVVAEQASAAAIEPASHWAHMLFHGTLHLLGYDHEHDAQAIEMEARERALMQRAGFADPYSEDHEDV